MLIFCCTCKQKVLARLTSGSEIYGHRPDLRDLPFWVCDACGNYVGCHHKSKNPTCPLGNIATPELRDARKHIHDILDPLWKHGNYTRSALYAMLSERLGWKYHTAKIRSIEEARSVYRIARELHKGPPR